MKKIHNRSQSQTRTVKLKRVPANFGWLLLKKLSGVLSSSLPAEFGSELDYAVRNRAAGTYLELAGTWTPQRMWSELGGTNAQGVLTKRKEISDLASCYLLTKLLAKWPDLNISTPQSRRDDAYKLFHELEARPRPIASWVVSDPVIQRMRQNLSRMLGSAPNAEEIAEASRHGPGSTDSIPYKLRSTYFKYLRWPYTVTTGAYGLLKTVISTDERWYGALEQSYRTELDIPAWAILDRKKFWSTVLRKVEANVVVTVPKDAAKDRLIAKEPTGNVFLQLGIGSIMKSRMRPYVNLTDQRTNQRLAREGSSNSSVDSPCTFDLSNASDTIHKDVVETVLPRDWFELLCSVRSEWGALPNGCFAYRKMSSMGNATTFELESALFMSLLLSISQLYGIPEDRSKINVFGDDLVFPRYLAPIVSLYLSALGFVVNRSKSFSEGSFMESCGCDYWSGVNIRPVFLRETPTTLQQLLSIRNRLNRWFALIHGTEMPVAIDDFFLKYIEGECYMAEGPETDTEFDTYWHVHYGRTTDVKFCAYVPVVPRIPGKDLWFRKLMHDLRSHQDAEAAGSRFDVLGDAAGIRKTWRTLCVRTYYTDMDGRSQDHCRPPWEEIPQRANNP